MEDVDPDQSPRGSRGIGDAGSTSGGTSAGPETAGAAPESRPAAGASGSRSTPAEGEQQLAARRRAGSLKPLARLILERIMLADKVAAAKFGTGRPIDDPVREHQQLNRVAELSAGMGLDPRVSTEFFRDQIEANKVVQRGLHALWADHPELRPAARPDLAGEVRPRLDELTAQILDGLRAISGGRGGTGSGRGGVDGGGVDGGGVSSGGERGIGSGIEDRPPHETFLVASNPQLDELHRDSLSIALRSIWATHRGSASSDCPRPRG
jgi:chorismate mutase